jgi:hypothetical protein
MMAKEAEVNVSAIVFEYKLEAQEYQYKFY